VAAPGPYRICCFIEHYFLKGGGAGHQARLLNEELVRRGHRVFVVTSRTPGEPRREGVGGVPIRRFPFPYLFWRPYGPSALRFLLRSVRIGAYLWARRRDFDVIHVHQLREPVLAAAFINRALRKPLLAKVVCSGEVGDVHHLQSLNLRPFFDRLIREVPLAVCLNAESAREVREAFPEISVLQGFPNGVDTQTYLPLRAGQPGGPLKLLFCGRLVPQKNLPLLIEAVARLRQTEVVDVLRIGGDGPDRPDLEALVRALGIAQKVQFLGTVTPADLYASGDTYVSTSNAEGMPNALLEAMACGLVPVCSDIPGHQELILPGTTGLLFPRGDAAGLVACLERLAGDPDLRATISRNARRRIEEGYSIRQTAQRYEVLYGRLRTPRLDPVNAMRAEEFRLAMGVVRDRSYQRVLEIGSGDGVHAKALQGIASSVVLTDIDHARLKQSPHPLRVTCRAEALPFRANVFDFAISSLVWEHLEQRAGANREVVRVLVDGGRVLHVLPTRVWKLLHCLFYSAGLPRRIHQRLQQPSGRPAVALPEHHSAAHESSGPQRGTVPPQTPSRITMTRRLAAWLLPPIHGSYPTHGREWKAYGRKAWFFQVCEGPLRLLCSKPLLFYSPYLFAGPRFFAARRLLGRAGLASTWFVLLEKGSPCFGQAAKRSSFDDGTGPQTPAQASASPRRARAAPLTSDNNK
jgi:glycosyltransferase involved in cell wall biosynthesis